MRKPPKRVKVWRIVLIVLVAIVAINAGGNYLISESNYEYNLEVAANFSPTNFTSQGYINSNDYVIPFYYGLSKNTDQYSLIVATYNALNSLKKNGYYTGTVDKTTIPEIIRAYDLYAHLVFGYLGINPFAIVWFFNSLGLNAKIAFDRENIRGNALASKAFIFYFNGEDTSFRAGTMTTETSMSLYGPNQTISNFSNFIYNTYADYFLALITINVE